VDTTLFLELYRSMLTARRVDELEASLAQRGEVPFYVPASGHEAVAALAWLLTEHDWLHCHYRDKALALARGVTIESLMAAVLGKATSNSQGRRMPGFPSSRALKLLNCPTLVGNSALQAAGVAAAVREQPERPIVYCGMGDGGTQEGEFHEAFAEAVRSALPVLFVVQDNRYALSTPTAGKTFYSLPDGDAETYMGVPLRYVDGADAVAAHAALAEAVAAVRASRRPLCCIVRVERLASHTNSDDQGVYRGADELARIRAEADPVVNLRAALRAGGVDEDALRRLEQDVDAAVERADAAARAADEPAPATAAKRPLPPELTDAASEYRGADGVRELNMLAAMREALRLRLAGDPRASLYGEDIEDPKGDVFGLTRGLSRDAGADRVRNAPLAEATIVGVSIGRALCGERPVAFLQFADFLPVAWNQVFSEMSTMYWRSAGDWECPVLVMGICGGYRPGLGPFHAQSPVSVAAHTPGLDVYCPSTAGDAAGLLNAAFRAERPALFFYPKSILNDPDRGTSADIDKHLVPIGKARTVRPGQHLTLVSWGSTMPICERVAAALEDAGVYAEVLDLRTLSPWDKEGVLTSARKTGRLLVVHEDNATCGLGGEIVATVAEQAGDRVRVARVAQADTYVPYHYGNQLAVLPSFARVLERAAEMTELDLEWEETATVDERHVVVNAIGSSPSDENITITRLHVGAGDAVGAGDTIASVEADKATMDISAPVEGKVEELMLAEGDTVRVGVPLARIRTERAVTVSPALREDARRPKLSRRLGRGDAKPAAAGAAREVREVVLSSICSAVGSRELTNEDLVRMCPGWSSEDIVKRTGIVHRHWIGEGESALTLGVDACRKLLDAEGLDIADIDALICSTGTPPSTTPSLACRILKELSPEGGELMMQAHDINAACSGYLYALQEAHDMLQHDPAAKILIVTSETLSPVLDSADPQTFFLFGDAATASLVSCERRGGNIHAIVRRPHLSALGAEERILYVPSIQSREFLEMDGKPVFRIAVRKMIDMLDRACAAESMTVDDLAMIVPHQANERIMEAIRKAIKFPTDKVFYFIRDYGNTSSNTIPLSLEALSKRLPAGDRVGLTAFGGGFTFAAGVLEIL